MSSHVPIHRISNKYIIYVILVHDINSWPTGVIFFLSMLWAWAVFNCLILGFWVRVEVLGSDCNNRFPNTNHNLNHNSNNGTSNSSNTDVVEKVNLLVAASQHGGTSVAEGSP